LNSFFFRGFDALKIFQKCPARAATKHSGCAGMYMTTLLISKKYFRKRSGYCSDSRMHLSRAIVPAVVPKLGSLRKSAKRDRLGALATLKEGGAQRPKV